MAATPAVDLTPGKPGGFDRLFTCCSPSAIRKQELKERDGTEVTDALDDLDDGVGSSWETKPREGDAGAADSDMPDLDDPNAAAKESAKAANGSADGDNNMLALWHVMMLFFYIHFLGKDSSEARRMVYSRKQLTNG